MPSTPYDAKGLLVSAIQDGNPVVYIDDRWLYNEIGDVPEEIYAVPIGKGVLRREGKAVTIAAISYMVKEAMETAEVLQKEGVDVEVIDIRTIKPLDKDLLLESVKKTGRLVVADGAWKTCGVAAEISAIVAEENFQYLKAPIKRVTLRDIPAPASSALEKVYYPNKNNIIEAVKKIISE